MRTPDWDISALNTGALISLIIAVPLWVAASWTQSQGRTGLTALFTLTAFAGFILGAAASAWAQRRGLPLAHGIITAVGTYLGVQIVVSVVRLATGGSINPISIVFFMTMAAGAGLIGGFVGMRMRRAGMIPARERVLRLEGDSPSSGGT